MLASGRVKKKVMPECRATTYLTPAFMDGEGTKVTLNQRHLTKVG